MASIDERRFYKKLRRQAGGTDFVLDRLENAVGEGWPDVLARGPGGSHAWLELKIATGARASVKIRPEQIIWAEDHVARGGVARLLALDEETGSHFWVVAADKLRVVAERGCLGEPRYHISKFAALLGRWVNVALQQSASAAAESRSRVVASQTKDIGPRTYVSHVSRTRDRDTGHDRGPHRTASSRGVARGRQSTTVVPKLSRRKDREGEAWWA